MRYVSTRGGTPPVGFSDAVAAGLAPDGGLFVPESLPDLGPELASLSGLSYAELCTRFLSRFATDIPQAELRELVARSYSHFDRPEVAPLLELAPGTRILELFHGPTLAFKDVALQLLGNLYARQCSLRGERINVLGAASGDTGAAAIHGLMGRPRRRHLHPLSRRPGLPAAGAPDGLHRRLQRACARGLGLLRPGAGRP